MNKLHIHYYLFCIILLSVWKGDAKADSNVLGLPDPIADADFSQTVIGLVQKDDHAKVFELLKTDRAKHAEGLSDNEYAFLLLAIDSIENNVLTPGTYQSYLNHANQEESDFLYWMNFVFEQYLNRNDVEMATIIQQQHFADDERKRFTVNYFEAKATGDCDKVFEFLKTDLKKEWGRAFAEPYKVDSISCFGQSMDFANCLKVLNFMHDMFPELSKDPAEMLSWANYCGFLDDHALDSLAKLSEIETEHPEYAQEHLKDILRMKVQAYQQIKDYDKAIDAGTALEKELENTELSAKYEGFGNTLDFIKERKKDEDQSKFPPRDNKLVIRVGLAAAILIILFMVQRIKKKKTNE